MAQKKEGLNGMSENEKLEQAADQAADKPAKTDKKKDVKADKKKPGVFARIGKWFKDMRSELKKVQWPTRKQTVNNTLIVIACVVVVGSCMIVGICIWLFDALAGAVITALLDLFGKG